MEVAEAGSQRLSNLSNLLLHRSDEEGGRNGELAGEVKAGSPSTRLIRLISWVPFGGLLSLVRR